MNRKMKRYQIDLTKFHGLEEASESICIIETNNINEAKAIMHKALELILDVDLVEIFDVKLKKFILTKNR